MVSADPAVDIGVVTWNTKDITIDALRRLLDADQGVSYRLLVWDNASSDGTPEELARLVPEAELFRSDVNLGFAGGVNRLVERGSAPWFLTLNSDAWPEPGSIAALVAAGEADRSVAAVAPRLERPDGRMEHSTYPFPSVAVAGVTAIGVYRKLGRRWAEQHALEGAWAHDRPRRVDWAVGAALLLRRRALEELGGLDERFFMYAEDLEWCWRASRRGWTVWFEPLAVVRHIGDASGSQNYGRARTSAYLRNTYRFYRREHGLLSTLAFRALNLVGSARLYIQSRARRDPSGAQFWADHIRAHVAPVTGDDAGPPG